MKIWQYFRQWSFLTVLSICFLFASISIYGNSLKILTVQPIKSTQRGLASVGSCTSHFNRGRKGALLNFVKTYGPALGFRATPLVAIMPFADNKGVFAENLGKAYEVIQDFSLTHPQSMWDVIQKTYQTLGQGTGVDEALLAASTISASLYIIDKSADHFLKAMARLNPVLVLVFASILTNAPELGAALMSALRDGVVETAAATPIGSNFYNPALLMIAVIGIAFMKSGQFAPLFRSAINENVKEMAIENGWLEENEDPDNLSRTRKLKLQFRSFAGTVVNQVKRGRKELGITLFSMMSAASFFGLVAPMIEDGQGYGPLYTWMALTSPLIYLFFVKPVSTSRGQTEGLADAAEEEDIEALLEQLRSMESEVDGDSAREEYHAKLIEFVESIQTYNEYSEGSERFARQIEGLKSSLEVLGEATAVEYAQVFSEISDDPYLKGIMDRIGIRRTPKSRWNRFKSSLGPLLATAASGAGIVLGSSMIDTGANLFVRSQSLLDKTGFGAVVNSLLTSLPDATVAASLLGAGMTIGAFRSIRFSNYTNIIISYIAISTVLLL